MAQHSAKTLPILACIAACFFLAACETKEDEKKDPPIKGLKVYQVSKSASTESRRYPSIIEPANESQLSFEIAGQLSEVKLEEGQPVKTGDVLMRLDDTSLKLEVQEAKAALDQAKVSEKNALTDFQRKSDLLKSGNVTRAAYDNAETTHITAIAQSKQAGQRYAIARERLSKAELKAPFEGVIANVQGKSFTNIAGGQAVVTLYSESAYEVTISVPASVINLIKVNDPVTVSISDLSGKVLSGRIQEISSRASAVSAFPVIIALTEATPGLKAGMAAEAVVSFNLPGNINGFLVPISAFSFDLMQQMESAGSARRRAEEATPAQIFVYDEATSTVKRRNVTVIGVRNNMLIVADGLSGGEYVAAAGVSYLHEGQKVKILEQ